MTKQSSLKKFYAATARKKVKNQNKKQKNNRNTNNANTLF